MSFKEVLNASKRISSHIHRTPFYISKTVDDLVKRKVFFKCENLQKTGSFKARGALNSVLKLQEKDPTLKGVVTHSSGNHGQALAWAASVVGIKCAVIVPHNTPAAKCDAIQNYGAQLVFCQPTPKARADTCQRVSEENNYPSIPPFDHYDVIAGQGTLAMEMFEDIPDLDAILVPISGGGLTSGVAIATKAIRPEAKVFAVEAKGKDLEVSLRAGKPKWPLPARYIDTVADGTRLQPVGDLVFPILMENLEKDVFSVTDAEIISAMKFIWERMKLVIEPSAALTPAAVMSQRMMTMSPKLHKIGVVLSGGNMDLNKIPW